MVDQTLEDAVGTAEQAKPNLAAAGGISETPTQSQSDDDQLEEGLIETFPASDPLASGRFV
jgi:hypothetical protein